MAMDIYGQQDRNIWKTWGLMLGFFLFVIAIGWTFSWIYNSSIILIIAVGIALIMNWVSYWYSDKIVLKISGAEKVSATSHPDLFDITENLCITAGLPMPKLYVIPDEAPNAFATGRNPEHAAVAVTQGLLRRLERAELEGVIAHELAHVGNRDILVMTVVVTLVGVVTLLSDFFLRSMIFGGVGGDNRDGRLQLIMILVGVGLAILSPIVAMVIKFAVSRRREFLADATGSLLTRYPEGLASALEKISSYQGEMKRANHATAHLYISNPFKGGNKSKNGGPSFLTKLFMTHPPVEERIKALRGKR
ncbi:MAG: M48 family metallopeptidase [Candidatus Paceibacterota bacterium]